MATKETQEAIDALALMERTAAGSAEARQNSYQWAALKVQRALLAEIVGLREDLAQARVGHA
jgi:hypothetical protein